MPLVVQAAWAAVGAAALFALARSYGLAWRAAARYREVARAGGLPAPRTPHHHGSPTYDHASRP